MIGDIELFAREIRPAAGKPGRAPEIAITGTNGKSTTTALIGHISPGRPRRADRRQYRQVGAGSGGARRPQIYVLELSSFQIDLTPGLKPDVAVLSNITPDHLDATATWTITPP